MRSFSIRTAGLLILALGMWGGLVPFVGPYFHFAMGPDKSWTWTSGRLYLDVLPALAAVLGGLILIGAGPRPTAPLGAVLAIAAGIWFAIGPDISHLWNTAGAQGAAHGSNTIRTLEMVAYHTGLGVLLATLGGYALPGLSAVVAESARVDASAGAPRRAAGRRAATGMALAGGAVPVDREATRTPVPVGERGAHVPVGAAASDDLEQGALEPAAGPAAEHERGRAAAGGADEASVAARGIESTYEPAAGPGAQYAAREGGARRSAEYAGPGGDLLEPAPNRADEPPTEAPVTGSTDTPVGDYAAPGATGGGPYRARPQTIRRRRGGLLGSLLARR